MRFLILYFSFLITLHISRTCSTHCALYSTHTVHTRWQCCTQVSSFFFVNPDSSANARFSFTDGYGWSQWSLNHFANPGGLARWYMPRRLPRWLVALRSSQTHKHRFSCKCQFSLILERESLTWIGKMCSHLSSVSLLVRKKQFNFCDLKLILLLLTSWWWVLENWTTRPRKMVSKWTMHMEWII